MTSINYCGYCGSICTKYLGPTNSRGARIKCVSSSGLTKTFEYDHAANDSHEAAARRMLDVVNEHAQRNGTSLYRIGARVSLPDAGPFAYAFTLVPVSK